MTALLNASTFAQTDGILAKAAPKKCHHLSKIIQNDFIQMIGSTVRNSDINLPFFSILADEVTDILARLQSWDIPITNCRRQEYDGTSNMSSSVHGLQGRIQQHAP